jgi:uncharacterized protein
MTGAVRVVLDTNVLLSVYAFRDSRFAVIGDRLVRGQWLALTNPSCLAEFAQVIARPQFGLDDASCQRAVAAYVGLATVVEPASLPAFLLPRCKDPEDQKFLELARDGAADWLVTSDKALLVLDRRQRLGGRFRILTPDRVLSDEMARLAAGAGEEGVEHGVRQ